MPFLGRGSVRFPRLANDIIGGSVGVRLVGRAGKAICSRDK